MQAAASKHHFATTNVQRRGKAASRQRHCSLPLACIAQCQRMGHTAGSSNRLVGARLYIWMGEDHQANDGVTKMKMTALAAAALVFTAGSAIAGSDHYGSNEGQKPATASDNTYTSSTRKMNNDAGVPKTVRKPVFNDEYGQGIWGH